MGLRELIERFAADSAEHMSAGPDEAAQLDRLEATLGHPLPASFRAFLERLGGGIYYGAHEIFGAKRAMIHDIELVPDIPSMVRRMQSGPEAATSAGLVPFHRAGGVLHFFDLRKDPAPVVSIGRAEAYPDFEAFLASIAPAPSKLAGTGG